MSELCETLFTLMDTLLKYYRKTELFFGNLKFAVIIIALFAVALAFGTFMESYHGTDYANRLVYKSIPFMGLQLMMFLSILFATLLRLPPKKHLYGFYTIHSGLIILFIGSFVTYKAGVDGTMTLAPNLASREIVLNNDLLKIQFPQDGKEVTVDLPYTPFEKNLELEYENIKIGRYLPFADQELTWIKSENQDNERDHSSRYRLYNDNFGEEMTLSLNPNSDFQNTMQLGLLNVHYMPDVLASCFGENYPEGLIIWDVEEGKCNSPSQKNIKKTKALTGKNLFEINFDEKTLRFFPEMSPLPLDEKMQLVQSSPYRILSKKLFEKNPHLFLFGKQLAYFDKDSQKWSTHTIEDGKAVDLPWMGFRIEVLDHKENMYPTLAPSYIKPIQENSQIIRGDLKAIEIEIDKQKFWVKSNEPIAYTKDGGRIQFELTKKSITLPYEIVLDQFKMDNDPGTNNPASYESFISLFKGNAGTTKHHVYMNNPLKHDNFTFYQASYFQANAGPYGSVLSVNFDPGRFWKYLGSLLLVLGSIWHYVLRRSHLKKKGADDAQDKLFTF